MTVHGSNGARRGGARAEALRHGPTLISLVLIALLAVQFARFGWIVAVPPGGLDGGAAAAAPAGPGDLSILARFDPFYRDGVVAAAAPAEVPAAAGGSYRLFGVRVEAGGRGSAILAGADGIQTSVRVGDSLDGNATLVSVSPTGAVIEVGGQRQTLAFEAPVPGAVAPAPPTPVAAAAPVPTTTPAVDRERFVRELGLRPVTRGEVQGYAVTPRQGGRSLSAVGLQAGDIITTVNGETLSAESLAALRETLRQGGEVSLGVRRGEEDISINLPTVTP